jgi:hypothetical protein
MEIKQLDLKDFRKKLKDSDFQVSYNKMLLNIELQENEKLHLLKTAIYLLNFGDIDLQKLGYKIIVNYSIKNNDYKPLYDLAINKDYIPISKLIEIKHFNREYIEEHFFNLFFSAYQENFKNENYYLSNGQKNLIEFSKSTNDFILVAPTSYGKSEIIINKVHSNLDKKVCIIVPSKALLAQTKKRLLNDLSENGLTRIITHPEMYKGNEESFVSVLTQERLLRLLQKNQILKFDLVLIDEAHNLFGEKPFGNKADSRALLLAQTIMILKKRNNNVILNFFSPFIYDAKNLEIGHLDYKLDFITTNEFIKTEKYLICDIKGDQKLKIYNQFSNNFIETNKVYQDEIQLIQSEKANKNIVYFNRPKHIEEFSLRFSNTINNNINQNYDEIINTIADFVHPDYNLLKCIKKGIVYHHGGMPELIRLYVESLFNENQSLEFIITSSTLLEGINIPAEKIFLFSAMKGRRLLSKSQFKNLIGRINRFSEIFNPESGNLSLLEPNIYVVKSNYSHQKRNIEKFLSDRAKTEIEIEDEINNILLKDENGLNSNEKTELKETLEYLENIEPNSTDLEGVIYVQSEIAKLCYQNNIYDFDIKDNEPNLIVNLNLYRENNISEISDANELLSAINSIFIQNIDLKEDSFKRLENLKARNFYSMILTWRSESASFKEMIGSFLAYWNSLSNEQLGSIYIGEKWGEKTREGWKKLFVDLTLKNNSQRVNLAILKIKEEQDYIEFNILKYIEILFELELVEEDYYEKIKYGTSDKKIITLLKNGFSLELAKCLTQDIYTSLISINTLNDEVIFRTEIIHTMEENEENKILIFEVKYHMNQ